MKPQDYNNHIRFYPLHHYIFYPLKAAFIAASATCIFRYPEDSLIWMAITGILIMTTFLSLLLRQHYALTLQNRLVRMELRLRYYILTQKRLETIEEQLSFGQLAALRFAPDAELASLVHRAVNENLSSTAIKKAIKNWEADYMRV
ncbi:MAG: hypothetical protein H7Y03_12155 [Chitinophagaceae bacterium]|nr:hypothetical protein [Chitinophagaceae bacterium]